MNISHIPAGFDSGMNNLMWLIESQSQSSAVVIDPGYATEILSYLHKHSLTVKHILITHHHHDHTDGVSALLEAFPEVKVYGPKDSPFPLITHPLEQDDEVYLEDIDSNFSVIETPGHTLDHICFLFKKEQICFVGDTVFGAGAGGLFEGTPEVFWSSTQKIMNLPPQTVLYYGHDYTLENLYFAKKLEKNNQEIEERIRVSKVNSQNNLYNGFSTVATEHLSNPFWRCNQEDVRKSCEKYANKSLNTALDVFTVVRQWR